MQFISNYQSPLGNIVLTADEIGLTGLWFEGQKYSESSLRQCCEEEFPILIEAKLWLDIYFSGRAPDFSLPLHLIGTEFQREVWEILCAIPYGKTVTYGEIAGQIAKRRGIKRMSAQAVGGAVGHNKISIVVPCHRVVGANGNLTGYGGGMEKKIALLKLEGVDMEEFFVPKKGTAL